jgi:hypothetical protein
LNVRLGGPVDDFEREMLEIRLDLCVGELAADKTFGVEDTGYMRKFEGSEM